MRFHKLLKIEFHKNFFHDYHWLIKKGKGSNSFVFLLFVGNLYYILELYNKELMFIKMIYLHQITHSESRVETKVNFFADYYNFVASQIEKSDYLDIENYLSLIEKIIFQIETNNDSCSKYIDVYLSHPFLEKNNKYFKEYKNYTLISNLFTEYKSQGKPNLKVKWINQSSNFKSSLIRFRTELKKVMFKKSLKEIISFLKCIHNISRHQSDFIHHTNIIISEFLLTNKTQEDIIETFSKIITRDIKEFPFPNSFLKENKNNLLDAKKEYIENRTFDQQFEGILNFFRETNKKEYFIFRIYNIKADKNFKFKYNQVTFYHPEHIKLKNIQIKAEEYPFTKDFFSKENMILAIIKINSFSKKIGQQIAINIIKKELEFLNYKCNSNSLFENHSYLTTIDFKDYHSRWSRKEQSYSISEWSKKQLLNNPYNTLKEANINCKQHFLEYESLYIKAETSRNPKDYWHYLETLLKIYSNKTINIIEIISSFLVLSSHKNEKELIDNYIIHCFINSSPDLLNMNREEFNKIVFSGKINIFEIEKEVNHPLINFLVKKRNKINNKGLKPYYTRILWECYSQRNSIMHSYKFNEKSLILIDSKLPNLLQRFREILINSMLKYKDLTFVELIEKLKQTPTS